MLTEGVTDEIELTSHEDTVDVYRHAAAHGNPLQRVLELISAPDAIIAPERPRLGIA
jgi:hypothetical protein